MVHTHITMFFKQFFRFTYNRLFFFVFLLFLFHIQKSFPFLFSLFLSSFPIIACTSLLLGLLLSFGNPNLSQNQPSETLPLLSQFPQFDDTFNIPLSNRNNFSSEEVKIEERGGNNSLILKKSDEIDFKDGVTFNEDLDSTRNQYIQLTEDTEDLDLKHEASSSRASSIDNVIPILDELHPLLDLNASLPQADSNVNADIEALNNSQNEEKEEGEEEEDEEEEDSNEEEEEEEEDPNEGKENDMKPRIQWTEDDQKNVMDLGTSELERNKRLENLMLRRRQRKQNIRLMAERNLIDLDSTDLNFPGAAISTWKLNPFDFPCDSLDDSEFGVMPGSAPSVLLPRRNPFDIPYDSNEEKPDLKGDSFHQDSAFHPKDTFFRRYESFTTRPSSYTGPPLHEKGGSKPKTVVVGEDMSFRGGNDSNCENEKTTSLVRDPKLPLVEEFESSGSETDVEDESGVARSLSEEVEVISGEQVIHILEGDDECEEEDGGHGYSACEPDTPEFVVDSAASSPKEVRELVVFDEEKRSCGESPPFIDDSICNHVEMSSNGGHAIREPVYDLSPTANVHRGPISSATIAESQPGPTTDTFVGRDNDEDVAFGKGSTFQAPGSIRSTQRESSEKIFDPEMENMVDNDGEFLNEGDKVGSSYAEIPCQYRTETDATPEELPVCELNENCVTKVEMINSSNSAIETDILDVRKQLFSSPEYLHETENGNSAKDIAIVEEVLDSTVPKEGGEDELLPPILTVDGDVRITDNTPPPSSSDVETGEVHPLKTEETGMGLDQMEQ